MNSSTIYTHRKRIPAKHLKTPTSIPLHAFSLPPSSACTSLFLSQWNGKPVCQPKYARTSQRLRVATRQRRLLIVCKRADESSPDVASERTEQSFPGIDGDIPATQVAPATAGSTSLWLVVAENAIHIMILFLAIAGSIHTRRRVLVHLVAILSVPQLTIIANRVWSQVRTPDRLQLVSSDSSAPVDEGAVPVSKPRPLEDTDNREDGEVNKGGLSLAQSNLISTNIRTAVAKEVDSLRYAIEQIEQTTEERQQARNRVIAEAIASLDDSLRSLRRSVETRNQVEKSAPFALVSELEIVKSRLKQSEREKEELEVRLRVAEDNFEEAKRQGERARREADEISSKELSLRTELAVASSRLLRLEEVTQRLETAERRNDELQEQIIKGTREQEGLRQSAEDAERRVIRVEDIAKMLREKIQELTGRPLQQYGQEGADVFGGIKEKGEDQFWPQQLRGKSDLQPDSVVYQELLQEEKGLQSPKWPRDPLGTKRAPQNLVQQNKLPDDGGFGIDSTVSGQDTNNASDNKLLSPEGSNDTIFSFSRGEFESGEQKEKTDKPSRKDAQTLKETVRPPDDASNVFVAPGDDSSVDTATKATREGVTAQPENQSEASSTASPATTETSKNKSVAGATKSSAKFEVSDSSQKKVDDAAVINSFSHIQTQTSEGTGADTSDQIKPDNGEESDKGSVLEISSTPASSAPNREEIQFRQTRDEASYYMEAQAGTKKIEMVQEPTEPVEMVQEPTEPVEMIQEPTEPVEMVQEPTEPVEMVQEPNEPVEMVQEPNEPVEMVQEPIELVEMVQEPIELVEMVQEPTELVEMAQEPTEPVEMAQEPIELVETVQGPLEPVGIVTESVKPDETAHEPAEPVELVKHETPYGQDTEPPGSIESSASYRYDAGPQDPLQGDTGSPSGIESQRDERTAPAEPLDSADLTSNSDHLKTNKSSGSTSGERNSQAVSAEATTDDTKVMAAQKTGTYLEGLSQNEQSRPPEAPEHQLRTAQELIKKARTRGLAVKQADIFFEKATAMLERALEQVEDRAEVEADLGGCLLAWAKTNIASSSAQERLSRALKLLTVSLESLPDNETVLFNTGLCYCLVASTSTKQKALEDYQMACDMYERLLQLNGNSRIACFNCGLSYVSLGRLSLGIENDKSIRGYFERATTLFQRSLELKPGDSKAISYLDDCRRQLKEMEVP